MTLIRLTKEFRFEMAHVLEGYDGPCRNVHGHSYILYITVIGSPINDPANFKNGMVMDFGDLKKFVNKSITDRFDHSIVINRNSNKLAAVCNDLFGKVEEVDFQPTCENLVVYFASLIKSQLPKEVELHHIRLFETASSYAEWFASDNR